MARDIDLDPLLSSPPFPGIRPHIATVLAARYGSAEQGDVAAAAAAIVAGRVGGRFWGPHHHGQRRLFVGPPPRHADLTGAAVMLPAAARRLIRAVAERGGVVVPDHSDPWPLIDAAEEVIGSSRQTTVLLALAAGRRVYDHDGRIGHERAEVLLAAALFDGRRYRDPVRDRPIELLEAVAILADWRRLIDANRGLVAAAGIAWWKRREVAPLLWDGAQRRVPFRSPGAALEEAREGQAIAAWPSRVPSAFGGAASRARVNVRWVEDGFLRSVGLGSNLVPPLSLTVDRLAPYFDSSGPTDLEIILATHDFHPALLDRARALRERIVAKRIGKYRFGGAARARCAGDDSRPMVLVVGQVEGDLSVLRGGGAVNGNLDLLKRVRAEEPDSHVAYRPHPDVEAGQRRGALPDEVALRHADSITRAEPLDDLVAAASRVHVLTSLAGFEALLRERPVVVHGSPFYAGWGLTIDRAPPISRRSRRLSLDQLVAGTLIVYPRYLDPRHRLPCSPEAFIDGLEIGVRNASWLVRARWLQGRLRKSLRSLRA